MDVVLASLGVSPAAAARVLVGATRTPNAHEWRMFLATTLLVIGAGLALSGIVSFFAFNWAVLGRLAKMAVVAVGMTACALGALHRPGHLVSRVLLSAASVLLGALLAVFGQSYQTGADPWGLFGVWALLILPWTLVAAFTPLWLLFILLTDVAYGLYVAQVLDLPRWDVAVALGVAAVHVVAVMGFEAQRFRARPWITDTWAPRILVAATLLMFVGPSVTLLAYPAWDNRLGSVSIVAMTFLIVLIGLYYRLVRPDTFMLTAAAGCVMAVITTVVGRLVMVTLDLGVLGFMVMTGLMVVEVTLVVSWLRARALEDAA
jgi:uncharacterized membrane protein